MNRTFNCFLTTDCVVIVKNEVLLVRRGNEPFRGSWCFPGGFVEGDETILHGAERELQEETGISGVTLEQFGAYGDPGRDPRGRTVSIVYWTQLKEKPSAVAGDDAADCAWYSMDALPDMAFDHGKIADDVRRRLKESGRK